MTSLVLATAFFVGIHLFVSGTGLRDRITGAIGEQAYLGVFSLASLAGISWMCIAYGQAPTVHVWGELPGVRWLTLVVTPVAFVLAFTGITTPSPTAMGQLQLLDRPDPARGILRITRHPFLWGVAIWAATHLLANGDAASIVLFAGLLVLTLYGPVSIDAKRARGLGGKWNDFEAVTSRVPFAAIAAGRNRLALSEISWWRPVVGLALWGAVLASHVRLFGASPLPL